MTTQFEPLNDSQWEFLEPHFAQIPKRKGGRAHAPWRSVVNSILLILCLGMKWSAIPKSGEFAPKTVANRWYLRWKNNGILDLILQTLPAQHAENTVFPRQRNRLAKKPSSILG